MRIPARATPRLVRVETEPAEPLRELPLAPSLAQPRVVAEPRNVTLEVLRALSHPIRLELIAHVAAGGPICTCHLEEALPHSQPTISKHLAVLRQAGLIHGRRDGRWTYYAVDSERLDAARDFLNELDESLRRPHVADKCD
jgi:ArsR family transcriptional regulator, arsenate/arsenite/antimonite-responsive transcriptional repressor